MTVLKLLPVHSRLFLTSRNLIFSLGCFHLREGRQEY